MITSVSRRAWLKFKKSYVCRIKRPLWEKHGFAPQTESGLPNVKGAAEGEISKAFTGASLYLRGAAETATPRTVSQFRGS